MKIVNLQCPNCGAKLSVENGMYVCNSCGTTTAIDYDDSDVEYERVKTEAEIQEKQHEHEKELLEKKFELEQKAQIASEKRQIKREREKNFKASVKKTMSSLFALLFLFGIFFGIFKLYTWMMNKASADGSYSGRSIFATPTPLPNYDPTPDDFKDQMDEFIDSGKIIQMGIEQCAVRNKNGIPHYYDKTDAVFFDAYLVTDIPEVKESDSNRLVIIYKVTWKNEDYGEKVCYDAVYFNGIRVNPNGGVISDYKGDTISRSDAAWGWAMAYSYDKYELCYRENVTALGGKVTKIEYGSSTESSETEETTETTKASETTKAAKTTKKSKKSKSK